MKKLITVSVTALLALAGATCYADDNDQIRQDCETEVQSYGITDEAEYQQALQDCIKSMTDESAGQSGDQSDNGQSSE
jgi:hypothetical protein